MSSVKPVSKFSILFEVKEGENFYRRKIQEKWKKDIPGYMRKVDEKRPGVLE